jgi:hypothetical protein
MKGLIYIGLTFGAVALCAMAISIAAAEPQVGPGAAPGDAKVKTVRPRSPGGLFTDQLGTYLTIEGVRAVGLKIETPALLVDMLDGKKLDKPIAITVQNIPDLPSKQRCVLKGYELGKMIGRPPAEYDAAKEQGQNAEDLVKGDALTWQWRPYFVVLKVVEPKALEPRK